MPRFPYFPYSYYRNPYYANTFKPNYNNTYLPSIKNSLKENIEYNNIPNNQQHSFSSNNNSYYNQESKIKKSSSINKEDNYFIELLGFKLYFDDVLILCLLFFLYTENIKDEGLFIALILLLIT